MPEGSRGMVQPLRHGGTAERYGRSRVCHKAVWGITGVSLIILPSLMTSIRNGTVQGSDSSTPELFTSGMVQFRNGTPPT